MKWLIHPTASIIKDFSKLTIENSNIIEKSYVSTIWSCDAKYYTQLTIQMFAYDELNGLQAISKCIEINTIHKNIDYKNRDILESDPR